MDKNKMNNKNILAGYTCERCHQKVKLYKRPLSSAMAYALILIHKHSNGEYIHVENLLKSLSCPASVRGDFPKLRFWGLLQPKSEDRGDGSNRNGYYKITEKGIEFVKGNISVASFVKIYNNQFYGYGDKFVDIKWCLKNKFNYKELMS